MNDASPPPVAQRIQSQRSYHNITIEDPYAWLKDPDYPTVDDAAVLDYLTQENAYFDTQMEPLQPLVESLFQEMKGRQPQTDESVPWLENGRWYQWRYHEGGEYRTWYWAPAADPEAFTVLLDERELATGHEYFRLGGLEVSPDHSRLAYSTDTNGSERYELQVIDLASRKPVQPAIADTTGAPIFSTDGRYLFYKMVNAEWRPYRAMRLRLPEAGEQSARSANAEVVYEETDPSYFVSLELTQSEDYLLIGSADHVTSEVRVLSRAQPLAEPQLIAERRTGHEYDLDHRDAQFIIRSNREHKNFALYTAPVAQPGEAQWRTMIAGSDTTYLTGHVSFERHTVLSLRENGLEQIRVLPVDGKSHTIEFPEASYSVGLETNADYNVAELRLGYESMVTPDTVYDYNLQERTLKVRKVTQVPSGYDASQYRTERLQVSARDGTKVPVSLVYHKDHPPSEQRPLYLYGYGAYGISVDPSFSTTRLSLLDRGVSFAIAHVRGGDDLGYGWYEDGKLTKRTNTFNDFADVARDLIARKYTGPGHIAIGGGSAGGELVGATLNQTRDIIGTAVLDVPFVDVLNTMLDTSLPLTPMEWPEWGNPIEDAEAFRFIQSYSPYDQLVAGEYPPILVTGGLNDPRVTYWEPAKYVAKLRTLKTDDNPLLLKINMGAGHGGQSGRFNALKEAAERYAFVLTNLGAVSSDS